MSVIEPGTDCTLCDDTAARICPRCGGANPQRAVFCGNPACHKALGDFAYIAEEFDATLTWVHRLADRVAAWVGHPHFFTIHVIWFTVWLLLNVEVDGNALVFDAYPYALLGIALGVEAALITSMLLINSQRQTAFENKRAELEYEANMSSYRLLRELSAEVEQLRALLRVRGAPGDTPDPSG